MFTLVFMLIQPGAAIFVWPKMTSSMSLFVGVVSIACPQAVGFWMWDAVLVAVLGFWLFTMVLMCWQSVSVRPKLPGLAP